MVLIINMQANTYIHRTFGHLRKGKIEKSSIPQRDDNSWKDYLKL